MILKKSVDIVFVYESNQLDSFQIKRNILLLEAAEHLLASYSFFSYSPKKRGINLPGFDSIIFLTSGIDFWGQKTLL